MCEGDNLTDKEVVDMLREQVLNLNSVLEELAMRKIVVSIAAKAKQVEYNEYRGEKKHTTSTKKVEITAVRKTIKF